MLKFAQALTDSKPPDVRLSFADLWRAADEEGRQFLDERAAIYEHVAGLSQEEAEQKAIENYLQNNDGALFP